MKKVLSVFLLLFMFFSLTSCTTLGILSEEEKKVKIVFNENLVKDCHFIDGFITGSVAGLNSALKKKAFKTGGDMVLVHQGNRDLGVEVYRCSEQPPQMEENVQEETNSQEPGTPE
ncbi:MAG: hypothetical protein OXK80_01245 [Bdellovibrionales bacterium]|nr:hypothetical protein [Bdellovibrionales bacterium]